VLWLGGQHFGGPTIGASSRTHLRGMTVTVTNASTKGHRGEPAPPCRCPLDTAATCLGLRSTVWPSGSAARTQSQRPYPPPRLRMSHCSLATALLRRFGMRCSSAARCLSVIETDHGRRSPDRLSKVASRGFLKCCRTARALNGAEIPHNAQKPKKPRKTPQTRCTGQRRRAPNMSAPTSSPTRLCSV